MINRCSTESGPGIFFLSTYRISHPLLKWTPYLLTSQHLLNVYTHLVSRNCMKMVEWGDGKKKFILQLAIFGEGGGNLCTSVFAKSGCIIGSDPQSFSLLPLVTLALTRILHKFCDLLYAIILGSGKHLFKLGSSVITA